MISVGPKHRIAFAQHLLNCLLNTVFGVSQLLQHESVQKLHAGLDGHWLDWIEVSRTLPIRAPCILNAARSSCQRSIQPALESGHEVPRFYINERLVVIGRAKLKPLTHVERTECTGFFADGVQEHRLPLVTECCVVAWQHIDIRCREVHDKPDGLVGSHTATELVHLTSNKIYATRGRLRHIDEE